MTRRQRRAIDLEIRRRLKRRGIRYPDALPCETCAGDGKRWTFIVWRFGRCRACAGTGRDQMPVAARLRLLALRQAAQKVAQAAASEDARQLDRSRP